MATTASKSLKAPEATTSLAALRAYITARRAELGADFVEAPRRPDDSPRTASKQALLGAIAATGKRW
jgi:hypothetical protein